MKPAHDATISKENSISPRITIIKENRGNEPVHPKVRKITTVVSTMAVVLKLTPNYNIVIWVFGLGRSQVIPLINLPYSQLKVGDWLICGIFDDGSFASFLPVPMLTQIQTCRTVNDKISISHAVPEVNSSYVKRNELGKLYCPPHILAHLGKKGNENIPIWLEWIPNSMPYGTEQYDWQITDISQDGFQDNYEFAEHEYRECMEFLKKRQEVQKETLRNRQPCSKTVSRHFGLVTDLNHSKRMMVVWSPNVHSESDISSEITLKANIKEYDGPEILPPIGQWIQFDIANKDMEKVCCFRSNHNQKLTIREYLPINTPSGMAICKIGKDIRIILTCTLVTSTDHPLIFDIPNIGPVLNNRCTLRSGAYMQVVIERVVYRYRRLNGINWKVVSAEFVSEKDTRFDKTSSTDVFTVPIRDSFRLCTFNSDKQMNPFQNYHHRSVLGQMHNNGYQNGQYQSSYHHNQGNGNYYRHTHADHTNWRNAGYTGASIEILAMVEKIESTRNIGIFWDFGASFNVHFVYSDTVDLEIGDCVKANLTQVKDDKSVTGFKWQLKKYQKTKRHYECIVHSGKVMIFEDAQYNGELDKLGRPLLNGRLFKKIVDDQLLLKNHPYPAQVSCIVTRKKINHSVPDTRHAHSENNTRFYWVMSNIIDKSRYYGSQLYYQQPNILPSQLVPYQPQQSTNNENYRTVYTDGKSSTAPTTNSTGPSSQCSDD